MFACNRRRRLDQPIAAGRWKEEKPGSLGCSASQADLNQEDELLNGEEGRRRPKRLSVADMVGFHLRQNAAAELILVL
jgi:hypothetical protein